MQKLENILKMCLCFHSDLATFPDWAARIYNASRVVAPVVASIPSSGSLQLLANATNAIVNGTVH